jgi:3-hydroxyacyl-CoA dehydrogenase/3-hydroxy-2-methylbutyryl-CoA dehydrogenase
VELKGCIALVAGGASGLGEATVRHLVEKGAKVSILDLAEDRGERLASEMGDSVIFRKADVTDEKNIEAAINGTMDIFGAIHAAINCAGIAKPAKVLDKEGRAMPINQFNEIVQINLVGTMNVIRLAGQHMVDNSPNLDGEKGVVVNTASIAAWEGQFGQAAYAASKAGVVGMTLPIAREFADHGIRVLTIAPGLFETPMFAGLSDKVKRSLYEMTLFPKRLGRPVEFARLVCHIIQNPMLNGEVIRLDGGIRVNAR